MSNLFKWIIKCVPKKTFWVDLSRSCLINVQDLLRITWSVLFYFGHTVLCILTRYGVVGSLYQRHFNVPTTSSQRYGRCRGWNNVFDCVYTTYGVVGSLFQRHFNVHTTSFQRYGRCIGDLWCIPLNYNILVSLEKLTCNIDKVVK